jgi:hypothetical protein
MIDQRFTLVLFDATANRLHWLVVDIPSASLAAGALDDGEQVSWGRGGKGKHRGIVFRTMKKSH